MARSIVKTSADLRNVHEQSDDYGEKFIDGWNELELDALICPAFCGMFFSIGI